MDHVLQVPLFPKFYMLVFTHSPSLNEETIGQPRMRTFKLVPNTATI